MCIHFMQDSLSDTRNSVGKKYARRILLVIAKDNTIARIAFTKRTEHGDDVFCFSGDTAEANSDGWMVLGNTGNSIPVHSNI